MKKNKKTKVSKYITVVLCLIAALIIAYVIIYLCFKGNGILTAGINLEKHDWLSFLGTYLSFAGSLIVSIIAIFQSSHYTQANKEENNTKRTKDIQPIFSIEIVEMDSMLAGYAETISLYHHSSLPRHKNFTLKIENDGAYPVKNVIIFNKYLFQLMKCNDSHRLQVAYDDSPDYSHESKSLIRILQSEYERAENGLPKWFNINYEDVDGNVMFQSFELKEFDGIFYYSLTETTAV